PGSGRAALRAQPAVHAQVLVLDHHASRLLERRRHEERLLGLEPRRLERALELGQLGVLGDREAIDRADVDARVALDAELGREHRLQVAVQAPLDLRRDLLRGEAELDLDVELAEALLQVDVRHQPALGRVVVVAVAPLVDAHLRARQLDAARQPVAQRTILAMEVDRDRGLVAVLDGPDDVLRAERRVAAEEDARERRLERHGIDDGDVPLVELDAEVALDPRERVLLADREHDVVARDQRLADDAAVDDAPALVQGVLEPIEAHPDEPAVLDDERLRRVVDDDLDALLLGVLELPLGSLEELARLARDDLHVLRAEAQSAAAAVHRGIADADDQHPLADRVDVPE